MRKKMRVMKSFAIGKLHFSEGDEIWIDARVDNARKDYYMLSLSRDEILLSDLGAGLNETSSDFDVTRYVRSEHLCEIDMFR